MATIKETLIAGVVERGIFPGDAEKLFAEWSADEANRSMARRWNEPTSAYPVPLLAVLRMSFDDAVLAWIDREHPKHWAQSLFAAALPAAPLKEVP